MMEANPVVLLYLLLSLHMASLPAQDHELDVMCAQDLSSCSVEGGHMKASEYVHVERLEVSKTEGYRGTHCICLNVNITFSLRGLYDSSGGLNGEVYSGGDYDDDYQYHDVPLTEAFLDVSYTISNSITVSKMLKFVLSSGQYFSELWISMIIYDKNLPGSVVFVSAHTKNQTIKMSSDDDLHLKKHGRKLDVPRLTPVIHSSEGVIMLILERGKVQHSSPLGMCLKYEDKGNCIYREWNQTENITVPLQSIASCLCIEAYWKEQNSIRVMSCPFANHTDFLKNTWNNVSVSVAVSQTRAGNAALTWNLSAPCRLELEVWLCRKGWKGHGCIAMENSNVHISRNGSKWEVNVKGYWQRRGEIVNIIPHHSLCVKVKVHGMSQELDILCPFPGPQRLWWLLSLAVILLFFAVCFVYLLHGRRKRQRRRGYIVLLHPPDMDQALADEIGKLASSLLSRGFSVCVDLWSHLQLSTLGPIPWLHMQLECVAQHGGKVVLILTQAAWARVEQWDNGSRETAPTHCAYADVFTATLSCILADKRQGCTRERFVLVKFESWTPSAKRNKLPLPELLRGLMLYSLPSQSSDFITELEVTHKRPRERRQTCRLEGNRFSGLSQDSTSSDLGDLYERKPLRPHPISTKFTGSKIHCV